MDLGLSGKRALVLGGNRGIGFGIARALAAEGARVAIAARDREKLKAAAAELGGAHFQLDLQEVAAMPAFASKLEKEFGPVDIVVNNTGGPAYGGATGRPLEEIGAVAAFLASERASYVTGSLVRVDGGIVRSI